MESGTALAIRHVPFEDLGSFGPVLRERGFAVAYRDAGVDDLGARDIVDADLLIVLGGPCSAFASARRSWRRRSAPVSTRASARSSAGVRSTSPTPDVNPRWRRWALARRCCIGMAI